MNPILPRVQIAKHHTQWHRLAMAILLPSLLVLAPFTAQAMAHTPENAPHKPMPDKAINADLRFCGRDCISGKRIICAVPLQLLGHGVQVVDGQHEFGIGGR